MIGGGLTRLAVKRPVGTGMLYLGVLVIGLAAMRMLSVDLLPEVEFPRISVVTLYEGVGPEEIETLITRPVEQILSTVEGVEELESTSAEGISRVQLQFGWGSDLSDAVGDVRAYLDRLGGRLPDDAERPVVYKFDLSSFPIAFIGVSGDGDPRRLRYLTEDTLGRRLERVKGVAAVSVQGGRTREIKVALDPASLVSLGVSAREVTQALSRDNRNISAGDLMDTGKEVLVRSVGEWEDIRDIENVLVTHRGDRPIYVRDLATVEDTARELNSEQWVDGRPGITMRVSKQSGANTVEVAESLNRAIEQINEDFAGRVRLTMLWDSSAFIKSAVTNVQSSALYGAALAILVLLLFLHNLRATLVIATAIPISVVATFALMYFGDFTLNVVSFGGLALGIGMLVDNAIVILENIYRKWEEGERGSVAAVEGAREVVPAVIAGTLTTVAVFAPVVFMSGFSGVFFGEMAAVVSFALLCSLLVAVTLVPTITARLLKQHRDLGSTWRGRLAARSEAILKSVEHGYSRLVEGALGAPWLVVLAALLLLVGSVRLFDLVGFELMPETDEGRIDCNVELPIGTPLDETAKVVRLLETRFTEALAEGELENTLTSAGPRNWWHPGGGNEGSIRINLIPAAERTRSVQDIIKVLRPMAKGLPGVDVRLRAGSSNFLMRMMRGGGEERLSVEVRGHDQEVAHQLAERVVEVMKKTPGIADARTRSEEGLPERAIKVDPRRAADLGLTRADVAEALETYVLGRVATRLREGGDEFDVRVQLKGAEDATVDQLAELPILTPAGATVALSTVASVETHKTPSSIDREGQERVTWVTGGFEAESGLALGAVADDLRARLQTLDVPDSFTLAVRGEDEEQQDTFSTMTIGILLAVFLVYMVMAVQFESLKHPLIIMSSVPFAFIGVVLALLVTATTFNMNSFLGAIVLVGIVVNNAIVFVDYVNLLRRERDTPLHEALVTTARRRLRPILMTSLTTALAMMPLALGLGDGSEIQAPMARAIIGGLGSSTAVTLLLVPCLYLLAERRGERRRLANRPPRPPGPRMVVPEDEAAEG